MILRHEGARPTGGMCDHHWVADSRDPTADSRCPACGGRAGIVETDREELPVAEPIWGDRRRPRP